MTELTHKGWFFLCPIYLNADEGEGMAVEARYWWLEWWLSVNDWIFNVMVFVKQTIDPDYVPMFPFRVTGIVKK